MGKIKSEIFKYNDFKIHMVKGYIESIPVIEYKDKILIMDSGCRSDSPLILGYIRSVIKRPIKDIKLAIASHVHPDHAGGVSFLKKYFDITIAAPEGINLWYKGFFGFIQHKIDIGLAHYVAAKNSLRFKFMYYPRKINYDLVLKHGSTIPFFEDWIIYSCKGHTTHDIVFYNEKENILYAADVFLRVKNRFYLPIPVTFSYLMKESINFIKDLNPKDIFLAHGGYLDGKIMEKAHRKLIKQAEIIESGDMSKKLIHKIARITPEMKKNKDISK